MSQNVPGNARRGHSRLVSRSWPTYASGTGLEPGPLVAPERLGRRADLVERETLVEVLGDDDGVHDVLGDVSLLDEVMGVELRDGGLVAVPAEVLQAVFLVEQVVDHHVGQDRLLRSLRA